MITRLECGGGLAGLAAGASRARSIPARASASAKPGSRARGQRHRLRARARARSSRRRSARRGAPGVDRRSPQAASLEQASGRSVAIDSAAPPRSGPRPASPAASSGRGCGGCRRRSRTASVTAATVPHSRSPGRQPLLPGPGEHGADEVLARERDVERQAERAAARRAGAGSPGPARALRSKSSPGSIAICSSRDAQLPRRSTLPSNQRLQVVDDVAVVAPGPVDPRRPLDVHQHVAAAALGDQLEHLLRAAGDVVDRGRAGVERPPRHLDREGVGGDRHRAHARRHSPSRPDRSAAIPAIAGTSAAASSSAVTGGPLRAATAPTSSMSKPGLDQRQPVGDRLLRGAAARPLEHRVDGDVDDPGAPPAAARSRVRSASRHSIVATVASRPMSLRCVYTDLDGTLLGRGGSLFRDAEGGFSMAQARGARGLPPRRGRGRDHVRPPRAPGPRGRAADGPGLLHLRGGLRLRDRRRDDPAHRRDGARRGRGHGLRADRGAAASPTLLFEHFEGRLEYHSPWHHGRVLSHLFRGKVDVDEANALLGEHGDDDLRLLDNGAIGTPMETVEGQTHAYHLVPRMVSKAAAVAAHARARGYAPRGVHRGRRLGRGPRGRRLGRPLLRRRQRPRARPRPARRPARAATTSPSPRGRWATASTKRSSPP